jgi:hypothetical protein
MAFATLSRVSSGSSWCGVRESGQNQSVKSAPAQHWAASFRAEGSAGGLLPGMRSFLSCPCLLFGGVNFPLQMQSRGLPPEVASPWPEQSVTPTS